MLIVHNPLKTKRLRECYAGHAQMLGILLAFAMLLGLKPATAQTITATVRGSVTDSAGAVIAGASVTARNVATGIKTDTVTNHDGIYNVQFLPIGQYTVTASSPGFEITSVGPFPLEIDQIAAIDLKLKVGNTSVTISVSADVSPILQTQDSTLETTVNQTMLANMPLDALNFQFATLFVPGAIDRSLALMGGSDGNERDIGSAGIPSFNGNRTQVNNFVLDGVEMNETMNNLSAYNPAPDAIQEMRVITGNANAEYGNVNGGEVLVVTKGGTNQYHGSAYNYFTEQAMSANSWYNGYAGLPLNPFVNEQFGATIGGPIKKDKLFFFGDYLGFRYHTGGTGKETVPDAAMRKGDFSELYSNQYGNDLLYNNQLGGGFDTAVPYTANNTNCVNPVNNECPNQISIVNPVAKFLFAHPELYPLPNTTPVANQGDLDNYTGTTKGQTHNNQGDARVDYKASERDAIMGRYTYGSATDFYPVVVLPVTFPYTNKYPFQSFVVNEVHTFTPSMVNEFRAGISRTIWMQQIPSDLSGQFGTSGNAKVGIPFTSQAFPGFSEMSLSSNETNVGTAAGVNEFHENNFFYGDDFTWLHGVQTIKFGVQIMRYQQNSFYPGNAGALGSFSYSGDYTQNPTTFVCGNNKTEACGGYGFADFVLDQSSGAGLGGVTGDTGQRQYRNAYYVQDDWRIRPNLTLNLGLRYAHDQPIYEVNNKESSYNLATPTAGNAGILLAGKNGNSRALYKPFYLEFMPRVGFALQVSPRFVLRGGYGITDALEGTGSALRMTQNDPFMSNFGYSPTPPTPTASGATPLAVENGFTISGQTNSTSITTFYVWDPHLKPSIVQQFNLAWQYLLTRTITAQIGYVGQLAQHLIAPAEFAQWSTPATGNIGNNDCSGTIEPAAPYCSIVGNSGNMIVTESNAYANYNAMQATIRRQTANGLAYQFNYTWSKSMTNNAGFYGVSGVAESSTWYQNVHDPHGDYGPSGDDTRQAVSFNGSYEIPFGRGMQFGGNTNRVMDGVIGGWKLSMNAILYSGSPLTMSSGEHYYINSNAAHSMHFRQMNIRHRTVQNWFGTDPSAVTCKGYDANGNTIDNGTCAYGPESYNAFGNAQNGSERAPGFRQVDLSAFKSFKIKGSQSLELRGDAFNALNIASYAPPAYHTVTTSTIYFGRITSTSSTQRHMQVSLHYRF
jgi:hypothetical protein